MNQSVLEASKLLRDVLFAQKIRVVFAESCTAGGVAGAMAVWPGISSWLCGSFAVYRCDSKTRWLSIDPQLLDDPEIGPVSELVTKLLCKNALARTPEADWAVAVTGDIGPGVAPEKDGWVFCAAVNRNGEAFSDQIRLKSPVPSDSMGVTARTLRLEEAKIFVLNRASHWISGSKTS